VLVIQRDETRGDSGDVAPLLFTDAAVIGALATARRVWRSL
jgi:hypothetical protein